MNKINIALDEVREFKFSINAMVELENRFDKSVPELFDPLHPPGIKTRVALVRIGLKYGGMKIPGKFVEDQEVFVGDLIQQHWIDQGNHMKELMNKVQDALKEAGLIDKDEDEEDEKASNPSVGTSDS